MTPADRGKSAVPFEMTDRGFKHYQPIATDYGHVVKVYESSRAFEPCLWVALDGSAAVTDPKAKVNAHLSLEAAERLRDTLDTAIAQHYQRADSDA